MLLGGEGQFRTPGSSHSDKPQGLIPCTPEYFLQLESLDADRLWSLLQIVPSTVMPRTVAHHTDAHWTARRIDGVLSILAKSEDSLPRVPIADQSRSRLSALPDMEGATKPVAILSDTELDAATSRLLTEGGDDRLHLNAAGTNKYHCAPRPVAATVVERGSCTCSAPTPLAFAAARDLQLALSSGEVQFDAAVQDVACRLPAALGVTAQHEVIITPSGSDAELIPLALATALAARAGCNGIVNIIAAAGEVGSGSAPAAGGMHFSDFVPSGAPVKKDTAVSGCPSSVQVVELRPRGPDGARLPDYDEQVQRAVVDGVQENAFIVLHAVDGSKTGLRVPSRAVMGDMLAVHRGRLLVVLDACQCRSDGAELNWYLEKGAAVLVTASKFFCGPGFSGAVLLPPAAAQALDAYEALPAGLADYVTANEIPPSMQGLRRRIGTRMQNTGLLLRWACGLAEMEPFAAAVASAQQAMHDWVVGVRALVAKRSPALALLDEPFEGEAGDETRLGGVNSVVSIKVMAGGGDRYLDAVALKKMHRLLTIDASGELPGNATGAEREIAGLLSTVGQPVDLGAFGVLRLAIGAPLARGIAKDGVQGALAKDELILEKMVVLAKYLFP